MPRFVLLSTLTAEGMKTVKERPHRIQDVNKEIEAYGAKVVDQYVLIGPYDFLTIIDAPDKKAVIKLSLDLGSRGTIKIASLPAIPTDEFIASLG
jgi:uncharacterized protein with GYD domain